MIVLALILAALGIATLIYMPRLEAYVDAQVPAAPAADSVGMYALYFVLIVVAAVAWTFVFYAAAKVREGR